MSPIEIKKARIDPKKGTLVVCNRCGKIGKIPPGCAENRNLLVKCPCGNKFHVIVDMRMHYRKPVMLYGKCWREGDDREYSMVVENLSFGGLCFRSPLVKMLKIGDIVYVNFELRDHRRSIIRQLGIVRHTGHQRAGLEFVQQENYNKALAFFLSN
ncbi:MAG: PilZ domain-containing protein [Thermodesulforhabdaceae bacterium]